MTPNVSPEVLMPLYGWAFLKSNANDQAERRLKTMLRDEGLAIEHFNGFLALQNECRAALALRLFTSENKSSLLHALRLLGRARIVRDTVELHEFECLEQCTATTRLPLDTQIRLFREWLTAGDRVCEHLADIMHWASSFPSDLPSHGGWRAILRKRIGHSRWEPLLLQRDTFGDVKASVILDGTSLLREGRSMGNCLSTPEFAYPYLLACLKGVMQVCRLEALESPVMCATLSIEKHETGWAIEDFQTVGSGIPPARLRNAAKRLVNELNTAQGFEGLSDDEDSVHDIPPFLRRTRRLG